MLAWLRWFFSDSGIVMGVGTASSNVLTDYLKNTRLVSYRCKVCGVAAWKRQGKETVVCKKFTCFRVNGGWK